MSEPVLSPEALADLDEAWVYLSRRSAAAADRLIDRFHDAARLHARFPLMGTAREDVLPGLRCFTARPYIAFHRVEGDTIVVLRFLHGGRDLKRFLGAEAEEG